MKRHGPTANSTPDGEAEAAVRIRFVALACVVLLPAAWGLNFWPFDDWVDRSGTPLGADFGVFYLPGRMILEGRAAELYSHEAQQRDLNALFPTLDPGDWLPFRYPPWVAVAMAPPAALPYAASLTLFTALSLAALLFAWRCMTNRLEWCDARRTTLLIALLGWPIVWETLLGGQSSLFSLAIVCAVIALTDARRFTAAGAVAALATFKPNVLAWFVLGIVLRYPRMLRGALPVGVVLVGVSLLTVGPQGVLDYFELGSRLAAGGWDFETDASKVQGVASWLTWMAPGYERPLLLTTGFIATLALVTAWRRHDGDRRFDAYATVLLLLINTICNPYVPIYDLALLAAAFVLGTALVVQCGSLPNRTSLVILQSAWGLLYFGPHLSQWICNRWEVQPFPMILVVAAVAWGAGALKLVSDRTAEDAPIRAVAQPANR